MSALHTHKAVKTNNIMNTWTSLIWDPSFCWISIRNEEERETFSIHCAQMRLLKTDFGDQ